MAGLEKGLSLAVLPDVRMRTLGLIGALLIAVLPRPAEAQGDFIKSKLKDLIEKSGVYVSAATRTAVDSDVDMGPTFGIGYGTAGQKRNGWKFPFSFSGYRGALTSSDVEFGEFKAQQIMSGVGYQWVHGKMVYSTQLGLGYSFNKITLNPAAPTAFNSSEAVRYDVSDSFVVRPQVKAEYFLHPKISLRTQLSYTYTDPDVVVHTATGSLTREWRPHHVHLSFAVGFFPFRK
jgi:hypothetical protein